MSIIELNVRLSGLVACSFILLSAGSVRADSMFYEEKQTTKPELIERFVFTSPAACRSNYEKRLADMVDQINMGESRGWLTAQRADYFRRWAQDCRKEVEAFRGAGGGIVAKDNVNQLERHVNSLEWMIEREIHAGSTRS